jgi:hypothetical protein
MAVIHYILRGHTPVPIKSVQAWAEWFEHSDARRIAHDRIEDVLVSTVFLGLDHNFGRGRPILFETLVFGGPLDGTMERYSTWDEAEIGHTDMLQRVTDATPPGPAPILPVPR